MLSEIGAPVNERRYFDDRPTLEEVKQLAAKLPGGVQDLVAVRGRRFREMGLAGKTLSDEQWAQLLVEEPGLWRRPIAIKGDEVVIGYDPEALRRLAGAEEKPEEEAAKN